MSLLGQDGEITEARAQISLDYPDYCLIREAYVAFKFGRFSSLPSFAHGEMPLEDL